MALNIVPEIYFHNHAKEVSTPNLNLPITVSSDGGNWTLFNDSSFVFTINGNVFVSEYSGSGTQTIYIGLTFSVNEWDNGLFEKKLRVISGEEEKVLTIYILVSELLSENLAPSSLSFTSIRNVDLAAAQTIYIASTDSILSLNVPSWLSIISNEVLGNGRMIRLRPVDFELLEGSEYEGEVNIVLSSETKIIPVDYKILAGFEKSYPKKVHFTRDNEELIFYKTVNETSFLRLYAEVFVYDYKGILINNFTLPLDLPFIDNRAKINIGRELETYFKLFDAPLAMNNKVLAFYPPMQVNLTASEMKYSDFTIVNQDILKTQYFLKGRNPKGFNNIINWSWLALRPNKERYVTKNSTIFLQIFKPAEMGLNKIHVYLNEEFLVSIDRGNNGFNFHLPYFLYARFLPANYDQIVPGDSLTFEYDGMTERREFIIKPEQPYSFKIAYQTIWETMDVFEFTGPATFNVDYTHSTTNVMKNYVDITTKIETLKPQKLTINTGWLMAEDTFLIDEIISSKKAFLLIESSFNQFFIDSYSSESFGHIELIPISQKIVNYDSKENLVSFDVEFEINKRYEDEIYSR